MRTSQSDRQLVTNRLMVLGINLDDAFALRRIAMTLHRWDELECGSDSGCVERDETTGKTYWLNANTGKRWPTPDREAGALRRLEKLRQRYTGLLFYHQSDCRGASVYVLRASDVRENESLESVYNRGVAVY